MDVTSKRVPFIRALSSLVLFYTQKAQWRPGTDGALLFVFPSSLMDGLEGARPAKVFWSR